MVLDRRQFLTATAGAGTIALAGCIEGGGSAGTNVGMVYATGGLGDDSFNDMAHQGIQRAEEEFDISFENMEPQDQNEVETYQRQLADSGDFDLICCIGFVQVSGLLEIGPEYPDQNFMLVDSVAETEDGELLDNVSNYVFKEHHGSFQVGYLAGMLSSREFGAGAGETNDENVVGFVGGVESPLIKKFEAGFMAGVEYADADIEVRSAYAGSWNDPSTGREIATSMYDEGADFVYHAAGSTGSGVFEAAQQAGRYAIGVDDDQSISAETFSDVIVASMVKYVDTAVYDSVSNVVDAEFQGGVNELGLGDDGVECVYGQDFEGEIPEDVTQAIDESRQAIVDGDIDVPRHPDDL